MWTVFVALLAGFSTAPTGNVAATVNGRTILVSEIDTPSQAKIAQLREDLSALATRTVDRLVDVHLRALAPAAQHVTPPLPRITDEEIRAFRATYAEDFEGPLAPSSKANTPAVEGAAIRYYLEQQAREAAELEVCRRLRDGHAIKLLLPPVQELEQALPAKRVVARVDGVSIRAEEVERAAALRLYRLRGEIYRERQRNLEAAIDDLLLTQEAQRRDISTQALLLELSAAVTTSDEEVQAFVAAERAAGRPAPPLERARPYVEFHKSYTHRQALLDKLRAAVSIKLFLKEPAVPRLPLVEADASVLGARIGPRLVVYTNYRCSPCRAVHREIDRLLADDRTVRVIFRDFVPVYDPAASEAARLSRCAARLGAFARMRAELLGREPPAFGFPWYKEGMLRPLANKLKINPRTFLQCLSAPETQEVITRDTAHARELGFDEAPAIVAEGIPLSGMQSADSLARTLRKGALSK